MPVTLTSTPATEKVTKELFTEPLPSHLECEICLDVLRNPFLTGCCGQSYCKDCIDKVTNKTCPHCRKTLETFPDKKSIRLINELEIKCHYFAEGKCQWKGSPAAFPNHIVVCDFKQTNCPLGCGAQLEKKAMASHTEKDCVLREVSCKHCQKQIAYLGKTNHKYSCPKMPIHCVNKCSNVGDILREEMDEHLKMCPNQLVPCEYSEFGCNKKIKRQDLPQHLSSSMEHHLFLVAENAKKERVARIALEKELKEEIQSLKTIIASYR